MNTLEMQGLRIRLIGEVDRLYHVGDLTGRNRLLGLLPREWWYGRDLVPE